MEVLILRLIVKRLGGFKLCHVIWGIDISFEKLTPEIGFWIWKAPFAHNGSRGGDFMQSLSF